MSCINDRQFVAVTIAMSIDPQIHKAAIAARHRDCPTAAGCNPPAEKTMFLFDAHQVPTEPVPVDEPPPEQNPVPDKDPVPDHNPVNDPRR